MLFAETIQNPDIYDYLDLVQFKNEQMDVSFQQNGVAKFSFDVPPGTLSVSIKVSVSEVSFCSSCNFINACQFFRRKSLETRDALSQPILGLSHFRVADKIDPRVESGQHALSVCRIRLLRVHDY